MKSKAEISNRLINYSLLATGIIGVHGETIAQTVYTDIDPDVLLFEEVNEDEGWKYFDFNVDGINDVALNFSLFYGCGYCPYYHFFNVSLNGENEIITEEASPCFLSDTWGSGYSSTECYIPPRQVADLLVDGDTISLDDNWNNIWDIFNSEQCGMYGEGCQQGAFPGGGSYSNNLLGFKIISTDTNYCWMRLQWNSGKLYAKDFACQLTPGEPLIIHDPIADAAKNIILTNDTCTGTTDEFTVHFTKAADESTVSEYRIFLSTINVTMNSALLIEPENYFVVAPNGNDQDVKLPPGLNMYNGDETEPGVNYKAYVMSFYKLPVTSEASMSYSLFNHFGDGIADAPEHIQLSVKDSTGTSADFTITSNENIDESITNLIRLIFVKASESGSFDLPEAESVLPGNYISIAPLDYFYVHVLPGMRDWNGDLLEPFTNYRVFPLGMYKDGFSCANYLGYHSTFCQFEGEPTQINNIDPAISVFNNHGFISVHCSGIKAETVLISNMSGSIVYQHAGGSEYFNIPFPFANGIYFIQIVSGEKRIVQQFVVG